MADTKRMTSPDADGAAPRENENLDKVRDILFGSQMRDQEKRFARMEDKVAKDLGDLREETRKRLDALETFIKKEVQSLLDRIKSEQGQRTEAVKSLGQELREMGKTFEARAGELDDHTSQVQREIREELLEQSKTLRDEIYKSQQESGASMDRAVQELRHDKVDRSALANMLTEIAIRVGGEEEEQ